MSIETLEEKLKRLKQPQEPMMSQMTTSPEENMRVQRVESNRPIEVDGIAPTKVNSNSRVKSLTSPTPLDSGDVKSLPSSSTFPIFPPSAPKQGYNPNAVTTAQYAQLRNTASTADYGDIEDRINNLRKDTSWIDLAAMGLATGIGAMYGQVGAGASAAGEYGIRRAKETEDRNFALDKALLDLKRKRAESLAKSGKLPTLTWRDKAYVDETTGETKLKQYVDPDTGLPVRHPTDEVIQKDQLKLMGLQNPDGSTTQILAKGNRGMVAGGQNASMSTLTDAEGRTHFYNPRTYGREGQPTYGGARKNPDGTITAGDNVNKTSMGLSKGDTADWTKIYERSSNDPIMRGAMSSNLAAQAGLHALNRGDVMGALEATKRIASALEDGKLVSDQDFRAVSGVNLGLIKNLEARLERMKGGRLTDEIRQEMTQTLGSLIAGSENSYNQRSNVFNNQLRVSLGDEMRQDLYLPSMPKYNPQAQADYFDRIQEVTKASPMTSEFEGSAVNPSTGVVERWVFRKEVDPRTGQAKKVPVRKVR